MIADETPKVTRITTVCDVLELYRATKHYLGLPE